MRLAFTIAVGLVAGVTTGACLPNAEDADRGEACWLRMLVTQTECVQAQLGCAEYDDPALLEDCFRAAARCEVRARDSAVECERRTGCIAELAACEDTCLVFRSHNGGGVIPGVCDCDLEFEICATWYDPACERGCDTDLDDCLVSSLSDDDRVACFTDMADCFGDCYDG